MAQPSADRYPPFRGIVPRPSGMPCRCWRSGGTAASAWSTLAGSREEAGWREMRFVNFAGTEGKLARNSSVYFKPSAPSYPSENAGQNSPWSGRSLKNHPLRPGAASGDRTGRNCWAGAGRILKYTFLFLASFFTPFRPLPLSRPVGDRRVPELGMRTRDATLNNYHYVVTLSQ